MTVITLEFLIIHRDFQDTISYEVDQDEEFYQVIDNVSTSFGFREEIFAITSALGFAIRDPSASVREVIEVYGKYFRLSVTAESLPDTSTQVPIVTEAVEEIISEDDMADPADTFHDVLDDLVLIKSENWSVDDDGFVEITVVPNMQSYVVQLRISYHVDQTLRELFTDVATSCRVNPEEIIVTPMLENAAIIDDWNPTIREVLDQYGVVFVIYDKAARNEIENQSEQMTQQVRELIFKYKRR